MKKIISFLIITVVLLGCSEHSNIESSGHDQPYKVIDIRVHSNYEIIINGESTSFYMLSNYLEGIDVDSSAHTRVFFNDETAKGALSTIQSFIRTKGLLDSEINIFSEQNFQEFLSKNVYIDILSNGSFIFNGKEIHSEDLQVALLSSFSPDSASVYLNLPQQYPSDEIISKMETLGFSNISLKRSLYY